MMDALYSGGMYYYLTHAFSLALFWGGLFFILGLIVGGFLWRSRRAKAMRVEYAVELLEKERALLKKSV
jgi:hypothetical protein